MPIDSRVAIQVNPPQQMDSTRGFRLRSLLDSEAQQRRESESRLSEQALKMEAERRALAKQEGVQSAVQATGGDLEKALPGISQVDPALGIKIRQDLAKLKDDEVRQAETQLKMAGEKIVQRSQLLANVRDQGTWDQARAIISTEDPESGKQLPERYNPDYVQFYIGRGKTLAQRATEAHNATVEELQRRGQDLTASSAEASRALTQRGQDLTAAGAEASRAVTMRGQDIGAQTAEATRLATDARAEADRDLTRRGQDVSAATTRRGQDLTDSRSKQALELSHKLEGAKLEQGAVTKVAEIQDGILQVQNLRDAIEKGKGLMGPVKGLATAPVIGRVAQFMGYTSPAMLEAKINLIKQTIGKALEGGVLRKEDEEKYAKILPTLSDTPEVALSKVADLEAKLNADLKTFIETQKASGRRVPNVGGSAKDPLGIR